MTELELTETATGETVYTDIYEYCYHKEDKSKMYCTYHTRTQVYLNTDGFFVCDKCEREIAQDRG